MQVLLNFLLAVKAHLMNPYLGLIMRQEILSGWVSFLVDEGILDPNTTINGQSSARKQNAKCHSNGGSLAGQ